MHLPRPSSESNNMTSPNLESEITNEVRTAFESLADAAQALDVERYLAFFDEQRYSGLNEDGSVSHSLAEFAPIIEQQFPELEKYLALEFSRVKITVINSTTAILVNEYSASVLLKSGDEASAEGGGSQVWSKDNGSWQLVCVSSAGFG
ncbi:MAG: ketosteroid isomerase-like protein [Mariniblastus sp.]|jgi:ketosteroid isomerase-like protein